MILDRRELLGALGVASASSLLWALGCGGRPAPVTPERDRGEVRTWLRDAVARLAAVFPEVHALAVSRRHTAAAVDILGAGVARARRDGVVLAVRGADGRAREQVTSDLTRGGIAAAVRALAGVAPRRAALVLPPPPASPPTPPPAPPLDDRSLRDRVEDIARRDSRLRSRIVYSAALLDVDDAHVWSISPTHDREQRRVRVRERVVRAAWSGARPVVGEAAIGWTGGLADRGLDQRAIEQATEDALLPMTPGAFSDGERAVILDPSLAALLIGAGARALLTGPAARGPRAEAEGALSPMLTLIDDPTAPGAYGGFEFDDEGTPAAPIVLVDAGRIAGRLAGATGGAGGGRGLRPGHVGALEPRPSHLRLAPGPLDPAALRDSGVILEGALGVTVDPAGERIVLGAARARELAGGALTGRIHADVELVGELRALLAGVSGVARAPLALPYRDERGGEPVWRSIEAPHVRTRGLVRARRRPA